jgi:hypothetical protein
MKINSTPIPNSTVLGDSAGNLFLRGEHPDKRSDKEFIRLMEQRFARERNISRAEGYWTSREVKCLNNGKIYRSVSNAAKLLGVSKGSIGNVLRGRCSSGRGLFFRYVD